MTVAAITENAVLALSISDARSAPAIEVRRPPSRFFRVLSVLSDRFDEESSKDSRISAVSAPMSLLSPSVATCNVRTRRPRHGILVNNGGLTLIECACQARTEVIADARTSFRITPSHLFLSVLFTCHTPHRGQACHRFCKAEFWFSICSSSGNDKGSAKDVMVSWTGRLCFPKLTFILKYDQTEEFIF